MSRKWSAFLLFLFFVASGLAAEAATSLPSLRGLPPGANVATFTIINGGTKAPEVWPWIVIRSKDGKSILGTSGNLGNGDQGQQPKFAGSTPLNLTVRSNDSKPFPPGATFRCFISRTTHVREILEVIDGDLFTADRNLYPGRTTRISSSTRFTLYNRGKTAITGLVAVGVSPLGLSAPEAEMINPMTPTGEKTVEGVFFPFLFMGIKKVTIPASKTPLRVEFPSFPGAYPRDAFFVFQPPQPPPPPYLSADGTPSRTFVGQLEATKKGTPTIYSPVLNIGSGFGNDMGTAVKPRPELNGGVEAEATIQVKNQATQTVTITFSAVGPDGTEFSHWPAPTGSDFHPTSANSGNVSPGNTARGKLFGPPLGIFPSGTQFKCIVLAPGNGPSNPPRVIEGALATSPRMLSFP